MGGEEDPYLGLGRGRVFFVRGTEDPPSQCARLETDHMSLGLSASWRVANGSTEATTDSTRRGCNVPRYGQT
ncbi:MAG: hypothetical protein QG621_447 [Patescibacteria group bacterium]|nr:hypothetical protein [Patescibacteria group bacterium]